MVSFCFLFWPEGCSLSFSWRHYNEKYSHHQVWHSVAVQQVFIKYSARIKHFGGFCRGCKKKQEADSSFLPLWIKFKILITVKSGLISPPCLFLSVSMCLFTQQTLWVAPCVHSPGTQTWGARFPGDIGVSLFLWHSCIITCRVSGQKLFLSRDLNINVPHTVCLFVKYLVRRTISWWVSFSGKALQMPLWTVPTFPRPLLLVPVSSQLPGS